MCFPETLPSNPIVREGPKPPLLPQTRQCEGKPQKPFLFCFPVFFFLMCWGFLATNPKNVSGNKALQNFLASIQLEKSFLTSQY